MCGVRSLCARMNTMFRARWMLRRFARNPGYRNRSSLTAMDSVLAHCSEMRAHLDRGDMLVLYTDGVTEANNAAYEEFDEERFIEVLKANRTLPATGIVQAVIHAVTGFAAGAPQADDITLLVAKRL